MREVFNAKHLFQASDYSHDLSMLRYSEIPRDVSGDSLAALKISEVGYMY